MSRLYHEEDRNVNSFRVFGRLAADGEWVKIASVDMIRHKIASTMKILCWNFNTTEYEYDRPETRRQALEIAKTALKDGQYQDIHINISWSDGEGDGSYTTWKNGKWV